MPLRGRIGAIAIAALLPVASCTDTTSDSDSESEDASSSPLAALHGQRVEWGGCAQGGGGECAGIDVPLDYDRPNGETTYVSMRRFRARERDNRIGTLLYNPGGPGGSGVATVAAFVRSLPPLLRDRFDIVGFDPRGIGTSQQLECRFDVASTNIDFIPETRSEQRRFVNAIGTANRSCVNADRRLARHMSTVEVARDLDLLRSALGEEQLYYFGTSYGTRIGANYAELFPKRVGRMVLDAAMDPARPLSRSLLGQARGHQQALNGYLTYCVRQGCGFGSDRGQAMAWLTGLLSDLEAEPKSVGADEKLTREIAVRGVAEGLRSSAWDRLTRALRAADRGEGAPLHRLSYLSTGRAATAARAAYAGQATACLDSPERPSLARIRRSVPRFEQASPVFGAYFAWQQVYCSTWPIKPDEQPPKIDGRGAAPILVIGSYGDPVTPYREAVALTRQLRSSVLLSVDAYAHGIYRRGSRCVDDAVDRYLLLDRQPRARTC